MKCIGHIKVYLLNVVGDCLEKLHRNNNSLVCDGLFEILTYLWELLSPSEVYTIVSHSEYINTHDSSAEIVLKDGRVGYVANVVIFGKEEEQKLKEVKLPPLLLYYHKNVLIRHGSDHVCNYQKRIIVNDYCSNNNNDNNSYGDVNTFYYKRRITILKRLNSIKRIDSGIRINGKYSYNYYHNLYEHLIRLIPIRENNGLIPADVPIVIDEDIWNTPSLRQIYQFLGNSLGRETIVVSKSEGIFVNNLYTISDVNYLVPKHIDFMKGSIEDYVFDKDYTLKLRKILLPNRIKSSFPKRFFITRKYTNHRNFNEDEIFAILEPFGFEIVAPEKYTFDQQMSLFNEAECIVGGSGAAFTNLLFCSSSCMIVCLFKQTPYFPPVFTAPVCFNNARMVVYVSKEESYDGGAHGNFSINVAQFKQFFNDFVVPTLKK